MDGVSSRVDEYREFGEGRIHDDIERLIEIASQLFNAIERQIHRIEHELDTGAEGSAKRGDRITYKEQLIQIVSNLDESLQAIAHQLAQRSLQVPVESREHQGQFLDYY